MIRIGIKVIFLWSLNLLVFKETMAAPSAKGATSNEISEAMLQAKNGNYLEASQQLYRLSSDPRFRERRAQLRYILGLTLIELGLKQVATYQFVDVVRSDDKNYIKNSLERLSIIADELEDDTHLNYAIERIKIDDFPPAKQDMVHFRMGELLLNQKGTENEKEKTTRFDEALVALKKIPSDSLYYLRGKYLQGYAYADLGNLEKAERAFEDVVDLRDDAAPNDTNRVAAIMGLGRVYYQGKQWDKAIAAYRRVPRDSGFWHESIFELSWALFRSGRFRTALSHFQTLHSAYYDDFYIPETLLLRAIVYLYICKYDEMDKVLALYEEIYGKAYDKIVTLTKSLGDESDHRPYLEEMEKIIAAKDKVKEGVVLRSQFRIPFNVASSILREGDFRRSHEYYQKLVLETEVLHKLPTHWQNSSVGRYAKTALNVRIKNARRLLGSQVRRHLVEFREELRDLAEQVGFLKYEMVNAKKNFVKRKIIGKGVEAAAQVNEDKSRNFYIQNGYEYWPFKGEYWLDEIGNYHYVGKRSCE